VSERFLSPEDLKRALKLQTLEAVYRLFRWKEGRYTFDQLPVSYPKEYLEPISTEHILMEGVRRLDEWPYIERKIPTLTWSSPGSGRKATRPGGPFHTPGPQPPATIRWAILP
jgi:hypothetical protein